ncbi:kinase-like protein, partial [Gymnopus androsaceus JB14]
PSMHLFFSDKFPNSVWYRAGSNLDKVLGFKFGRNLGRSDQFLHWPGIPHETEEIRRYALGGFHPVHLGDVFRSKNAVYRVLHNLGWGSFATVWLASRTLQEKAENPKHTSRYAALKICVANADSDHELNVHRRLPSESLHVANLLDIFSLHGDSISAFELTLDERRSLCYQVAQGIAFLHQNGVIHGDLHAGNIGVSLPMLEEHFEFDLLEDFQPEPHVVLHRKPHSSPKSLPKYLLPPIDLAEYFTSRARASLQMASVSAQIMDLGSSAIIGQPPRPCITPPNEVNSESSVASATFASDIWSLACVLFYIVTGAQIFHRASSDITHLRNMAKLCGEMPLEWQENLPGLDSELSPATTETEWRRRLRRDFKYVQEFGDLMKWILKMDPAARPSAEEVLKHPWFERSDKASVVDLGKSQDESPKNLQLSVPLDLLSLKAVIKPSNHRFIWSE